jgi:hypothetical protein
MGLFTKIRGLVSVKPVSLWVSELVTVPSSANLADVIFDAGDAIGPVGSFVVPRSGFLDFAQLYDRADLGTQFNIVLFSENPVFPPVSDANFALPDPDLMRVLYPLEFVVFKDYINGQISYLDHIGLMYSLPPFGTNPKLGVMYFQCYAPAAQTHVIGSEHQFIVKVYPDEPVK